MQMFLGASLMPEYFHEKVNLNLAFGPISKMATTGESAQFKDTKGLWPEVEYASWKFGAYN